MTRKISNTERNGANNSLLAGDAEIEAATLALTRSLTAQSYYALHIGGLPHGEVLRALISAVRRNASTPI